MTPVLAKAVLVLLGIAWYAIRYPYERRAKRNPVARTERGPREYLLMAISAAGFGLLPFFYICFGFPRSADYTFHPAQAWLGVLVALGSLVIFRLTHRALGHFWSVSLDVREQHALVTDGIYRYVRHPMYAAFWLWAIAQALLLPNWVAGFCCDDRFWRAVFRSPAARGAAYAQIVRRRLSQIHGANLSAGARNLLNGLICLPATFAWTWQLAHLAGPAKGRPPLRRSASLEFS